MAVDSTRPTRRLIVLGSTGSIGVNTLACVEHLQRQRLFDFEVVGLATGSNAQTLCEQAAKFRVKHVAIANDARGCEQTGLAAFAGPDAAQQLIESIAKPGDLVVGAMVGFAGVPATIAALERGCDVALANKETLVAAGAIVMPLVKKRQVRLLPIDSEHSALFQCLMSGRDISEVHRIIITASGGPFRTWAKDRMDQATVKEALNHPTWTMGPKVTIDSASLMNKALEIIEAHWLFDLPAQKIDVMVHPQSLIHSFVEYVDGSVIAQLGAPDMRTPIQYALTWPRRMDGCSKKVDWSNLRQMDFEPVDQERFAAPRLARQVIETGGTSGAILNAANEVAVAAFLSGQIPFGRISPIVEQTLNAITPTPVHTLADVNDSDATAREYAQRLAGGGLKDASRAKPQAAGVQ